MFEIHYKLNAIGAPGRDANKRFELLDCVIFVRRNELIVTNDNQPRQKGAVG